MLTELECKPGLGRDDFAFENFGSWFPPEVRALAEILPVEVYSDLQGN